jgi:hypothetical protein
MTIFIRGTLCLWIVFALTVCASEFRRVRFEKIASLTFHPGRLTTHRRADQLPQIACGESGCPADLGDVKCDKVSLDTWHCQAVGPYVVEDHQISCEGFDKRDDDDILGGSCALSCVTVPLTYDWATPATLVLLAIAFVLWWRP